MVITLISWNSLSWINFQIILEYNLQKYFYQKEGKEDLVGLITYRYIVFIYIILMFSFVEPKNDIRFLEKSII